MNRAEAASERREDAIDAEIAFHIDCLTRDLIEQGLLPEQARHRALAQFGDRDTYTRQCRRIAQETSMTLQRINFGLTIALGLLVIVLGMRFAQVQTANQATLQSINTSMHEIRRAALTASAPARRAARPATDFQAPSGTVQVAGAVARPGTYMLPDAASLSLGRLLAASGGVDRFPATVTVHRESETGSSVAHELEIDSLERMMTEDIRLQPHDVILVTTRD
jgi:type II secretory pathway pseudopilin PulG